MKSKVIYSITKHKHLMVSFLEMRLARPDFEQAVRELREKYHIFPDDFTDEKISSDTSVFDDWVQLQENSELCSAVESTLSLLGLPGSWREIALLYVIDGGESENDIMHDNHDGLTIEKDLDDNDIVLHIGPDTTFENYKFAWKKVQELRGTKNQHIRRRDNAMRDLNIFLLHKHGMSLSQICRQIDDEYKQTGDGISETSIRKIINEIYDRHNTPESGRMPVKTSSFS